MKKAILILFILSFFAAANAQKEVLTNSQVIEMSKIGLGKQIILDKIKTSGENFDLTANSLIELKKAGVDDEIITLMIEKRKGALSDRKTAEVESAKAPSQSKTASDEKTVPSDFASPKEAIISAKTIAFEKSSVHPSRQALEKELLKRKDWQKLNLTMLRYKESADLYVEMGFVSGSWITHRYVYRIYDRRSGAVLAAGETTSWGSLAKNLARHIAKSLNTVLNS